MPTRKSRRRTLVYPHHQLHPEDLLNFIELKWFTRGWDDLRLPDEELASLQIAIMCNPKGSPVIEGTRGLLKMRYAPKAWDTGKRGALRVCYVHFERFHTVLLAIVYLKGEQDDLSAAAKTAINKAIDRIGKGLQDRFGETAG
jgi:hypothetical protein